MKEEFYRRNLPHLQPLGGTFFVTYNLNGCVPEEVLVKWREEYEFEKNQILANSKDLKTDLVHLDKVYFLKKDKYLDTTNQGKHYLKEDRLAQVVADTLHFWDNQRLELICYCIMSNHVHTVFRLFDENETAKPFYLQEIMHSIKLYSANRCNKILGLEGQFWNRESYDRLVRDDKELRRILVYILNNPVKANLCEKMSDWKWSYIKAEYNDIL
jgi:putative transposase